MAEMVFLNDNLIESTEARISVADSGFLYGAGLFETMRSHQGVVFRLDDHLERLSSSARALSIPLPFDRAYLRQAIDELLQANQLAEARLRLTLTKGPMTTPEESRRPTLLITATAFRPYPAQYYETGVLVTFSPFRQNAADPTCGHKTTCYYPRLLALHAAQQAQAVEALWFTADERLAEGCVSNIFLVKNSVLYTPVPETPVLPGIARKTLCQLARQQALELVERDLRISDLLEADEVFLTNVIMETLPVVHVEEHTIGTGAVGPMTRKLREGFQKMMDQECRRQAGDAS